MKVCRICGVEFPRSRRSRRVICSDGCDRERSRRQSLASYHRVHGREREAKTALNPKPPRRFCATPGCLHGVRDNDYCQDCTLQHGMAQLLQRNAEQGIVCPVCEAGRLDGLPTCGRLECLTAGKPRVPAWRRVA